MNTHKGRNEAEINERKRMRPLWEMIRGLAESASDVVAGHGSEIGHFMRGHNFTYADLNALRLRPHFYDPFTVSKWEWFLHRAMNHFSREINNALTPRPITAQTQYLS